MLRRFVRTFVLGIAVLASVGAAAQPAVAARPVARWDVVPDQRLSDTFNIGVFQSAPEKAQAVLTGGAPCGYSVSRMFAPFTLVSLFGLVFGGVAYWARSRWFGPARECVKCGKVFRPEDNTIYCSQCVSVFLKRNAVSIEQQSAKIAQVRRWNVVGAYSRRLAGVLVPGGSFAAEGRSLLGLLVAFAVWLPVVGAVLWVPFYLTQVEPAAPNLALQLGLVVVGLVGWIVMAVSAWNRR